MSLAKSIISTEIEVK